MTNPADHLPRPTFRLAPGWRCVERVFQRGALRLQLVGPRGQVKTYTLFPPGYRYQQDEEEE